MHPALAALLWFPLAVAPQQSPAPFVSVVSEVAAPLKSLLGDARRVPLLLGRRFNEWVEDAGVYAGQARLFVVWQNTNNVLYLDLYQFGKRNLERVRWERDFRDRVEKLQREIQVERDRLERQIEVERRMKP